MMVVPGFPPPSMAPKRPSKDGQSRQSSKKEVKVADSDSEAAGEVDMDKVQSEINFADI
jgi:hypothetical protein